MEGSEEARPSTSRSLYAQEEDRDDGDEHAVSLREWLDRKGRSVDALESIHIFRQVVGMVNEAHREGVVVGNIRPSCLVMTTFNRVSFIESASCSGSEASSCEEDRWSDGKEVGCSDDQVEERKGVFPMKQVLEMEFGWYTSPEEAAGGSATLESDFYRLGVLLFELFCAFGPMEEKLGNMASLRHRMLPPQLLLKWPKQASFCLWLLHPLPSSRPKMIDVLNSELLNEPSDNFEDREAAIKLREDIESQELLLEFLLQLKNKKLEIADKLHSTISCLASDINDVIQQRRLQNCEYFIDIDKNEQSGLEKEDPPLFHLGTSSDTEISSSRKRFRQGLENYSEGQESLPGALSSETQQKGKENILSENSRLMKNFKKFELAYFQTRSKMDLPIGVGQTKYFPVNGARKSSVSRTNGSSVNNIVHREDWHGGRGGWLAPFLDGLSKYLSFSRLKIRADLKQTDLLHSSNLVCSLGFDRDKEMFATAGINKKIKIFECDMVLNEDQDMHYPVVEMVSKSKLSSICWNGYIKSQIASSDFEGVVQVWDVSRSRVSVEMREHERRVWCVDFSLADPNTLASGSDDGTVKLWNINQARSISTIKTKAYVCSVQFPPNSGYSIAVGSADHKVYCYDLRNLRIPLCTLVGHSKTVSYVKFVDSSTLVSASTDNSLKLWDLSMNTSRIKDNSVQTFTGHTNIKNFVGLSVSDGYIATGSETNEVFIYHKAFPMPMLSFRFDEAVSTPVQEADESAHFISSVCWRGQSSMLVAANSSGSIRLLEMA